MRNGILKFVFVRMTLTMPLMLTLICGTTSLAQNKNQVTQVHTQAEPLKVSVNQTIALDFSVPIKRAAIANEQVATVTVLSPKAVMIVGKTFGFTQLVLWDENGEQLLYDVRVDVDMERLTATIRDSAPRANVTVSTLLDTVVLSGTVPDAPTAERIVELSKVFSTKVQNQMSIAGSQQVLLRATIAEMSRSAVKALGLNGTFFGNKVFGGSNLNQLNPTSIGLLGKTQVPVSNLEGQLNPKFVATSDIAVSSGTTLYFGLPRSQMELFLQAMQENSLVKVLAEPNLVAISGQEAEFLAGGELAIPTPNENGIAITFREYGVRLKFAPVVQSGQMIRMKVTSEVSEPDYTNAVQIEGYTVPGLTKRNATTVVEVGSGQTFAIAGLLSESVKGINNKVPGAGDLPIIGALMRSVNYTNSQTELIVLITPDLAAPLNPNEVTYVPGNDVDTVNDWELYGLGAIEKKKDPTKPCSEDPEQPSFAPPAPLCGPWGIQASAETK
jgi:pilus assembly protein CpaC